MIGKTWFLLFLVGVWGVQGQTKQPQPKTAATAPIPDQLIAAVNRSRPFASSADGMFGAGSLNGKWSKSEDDQIGEAIFRMIDSAAVTSGERVDSTGKFGAYMQLRMTVAWSMDGPFRPEVLGTLEARVKKIDVATAQVFADQSKRLELEQNSPSATMVILYLAFQDALFAGDSWIAGQPTQILTRLKSIPDKEPVKPLSDASYPGLPRAAIALTLTDGLFVRDSFQAGVFTSSFPTFQKKFAEQKAKSK